jgi:hypothetical protein
LLHELFCKSTESENIVAKLKAMTRSSSHRRFTLSKSSNEVKYQIKHLAPHATKNEVFVELKAEKLTRLTKATFASYMSEGSGDAFNATSAIEKFSTMSLN